MKNTNKQKAKQLKNIYDKINRKCEYCKYYKKNNCTVSYTMYAQDVAKKFCLYNEHGFYERKWWKFWRVK